jgi:hypothetical protein
MRQPRMFNSMILQFSLERLGANSAASLPR